MLGGLTTSDNTAHAGALPTDTAACCAVPCCDVGRDGPQAHLAEQGLLSCCYCCLHKFGQHRPGVQPSSKQRQLRHHQHLQRRATQYVWPVQSACLQPSVLNLVRIQAKRRSSQQLQGDPATGTGRHSF